MRQNVIFCVLRFADAYVECALIMAYVYNGINCIKAIIYWNIKYNEELLMKIVKSA